MPACFSRILGGIDLINGVYRIKSLIPCARTVEAIGLFLKDFVWRWVRMSVMSFFPDCLFVEDLERSGSFFVGLYYRYRVARAHGLPAGGASRR
jgi:hypothetical protein